MVRARWVATTQALVVIADLGLDDLPQLVDVDGDGRRDLVGGVAGQTWQRDLGDLAFAAPVALGARGAFADLTGDGRADVLGSLAESSGGGGLELFASRLGQACGAPPTCTTARWAEQPLDTGPEVAGELLIGDVAGGPDADVVMLTAHGIGVLRQLAPPAFASPVPYPVARPRGAALVDVDGDRRDEIVVATGAAGWTVVDPDEPQAVRTMAWPGFPTATAVIAADVTGDAATDLVFVGGWSVAVVRGPGFASWFAFDPVAHEDVGGFAAIHAGDLNGDGASELLVPWRHGPLTWTGSTCVIDAPVAPNATCARTRSTSRMATVADRDGDGDADVLAPLSALHVGVYPGDGAGGLTWPATVVASPTFGWWRARGGRVVDATRDVVVAARGGGLAVYRGDVVAAEVATSLPFTTLTVADLDGDAVDELVVGGAVPAGGRVSILRRCP